jgi:hypothetical protein
MASTFTVGTQPDIAEMLRHDHDDIRAALAKATKGPNPIAGAAKRLAELCLPHFELEEKVVFPVLARMHDLALREYLAEELVDVQQEIADLCRQHKDYATQHHSIDSEVKTLLQTASRKGSEEAADLGRMIWNHERFEDHLDLAAYELSMRAKHRM